MDDFAKAITDLQRPYLIREYFASIVPTEWLSTLFKN
jgi:hypothetical protein